MGIPNIGAGQIAINFGMTGPNFTTVSACATGGHAIGESSEIIRRGDADIMVAGGAEAGIYEALVGGFASMRALSTRNDDPEGASRPFDGGRDGFVIGEGAGVVILEALEHAEARGATILAELVGYGATADASHITLPAPGGIGAVRAARRALEKAGLTPADIDHVNAHATSTPEGDKAELQAMKTILGERGRPRLDHGQQEHARPHARGGRRDRGDRDGHDDPRRLRAADDQPGRPGPGGRGPRPHAEPGRPTGRPDGDEQLVRVRWPEHGPDLPAVGRMTDEHEPAGRVRLTRPPPQPRRAPDARAHAARRRRRPAAGPHRPPGRPARPLGPRGAGGGGRRDRARAAQAVGGPGRRGVAASARGGRRAAPRRGTPASRRPRVATRPRWRARRSRRR